MWWLWGSIAVVLAVLFVASFLYDRRHKGQEPFGGGLESARQTQDGANEQRIWGGFGGGAP